MKVRPVCVGILLLFLPLHAGAVISHVDAATDVTVGSTTITVPRPSVSAGDLMVALIGVRAADSPGCTDLITFVGDPAWNLIGCTADGSTSASLYAYYRVAGGGEPTFYTWNHIPGIVTAASGIASYSGVDTSSPIHASVFTGGSNPGGETCASPSLTTTVSGSMVLSTCYAMTLSAPSGIGGPGPPWTNRWAFPTTGLLQGSEMSDQLFAFPGATGATVTTFTGAAGIPGFGAAKIALAPAPPPPTPTRLPTYTPRPNQVGQEFQVNSYTANSQAGPQIAMDPVSRDFVIVWSSIGQDGDPGYGVFGQRYESSGAKIGTEFQVNVYTTGSHAVSGVAMQPGGDFVVAWVRESALLSLDGDVIVRRGNLSSGMIGSEFVVNTYTTYNQSLPQVAALDNGGFVVTWESGGPVISPQDGWGNGVFARRLSSTGSPIGTEFQVNTYTEYSQWRSSVAPQPGGGFVVVWQSENQTGPTGMHDVFGQRFDSSGAKIGADFQVNTATVDAHQFYPHVDTDASGNFVVVWFTADQVNDQRIVQGQRFSSSGAKIGTEFQLSSGTEDVRAVPRVCVEDDGSMSAMWMVYNMTPPVDGDTFGIDLGQRARRYLSNGSPVTGDFSMNSFREGAQQGIFSGIACDEGRVIGTWMSERQDGDDGNLALVVTTLVDAPIVEGGVFASMFQFNTPTPSPTNTRLPTYTPRPYQVGQEFQVNSYTSGSQIGPQVGVDGSGRFVVAWSSNGQDGHSYGVFAQRYDSSGAPLGNEFQVSTYTSGSDGATSTVVAPGGNFVVVWSRENFPLSLDADIIARRGQISSGMIGDEFQVNVYTSGNQSLARAAQLPSDVVIIWESDGQDGNQIGVFGRRLSAGGEFQVNTYTTGMQRRPDVGAVDGGGFVVVWESYGQAIPAYDIFGQRFSSSGAPMGTEFHVNTSSGTYGSRRPAVSGLDGGGFIVAWERVDGPLDLKLRGRLYDSIGSPIGPEFAIGSGTSDIEAFPRLCRLADGEFVLAWTAYDSLPVDGDTSPLSFDSAVRARRFTVSGVPSGIEFSLNSFREWTQHNLFVTLGCSGRRLVGGWKSEAQDGLLGVVGIVEMLEIGPVLDGGVFASLFDFAAYTPTPTPTITRTPTRTWTPDITPRRLAVEEGDVWQIVRKSWLPGQTGSVPAVRGHKTVHVMDHSDNGLASCDVMCRIGVASPPTLIGTIIGAGSIEFDRNCDSLWLDTTCSPCDYSAYIGSDGDD